MKKIFYLIFSLNSVLLFSQNIVISSYDEDLKVSFAKLTDTISYKISYTDEDGAISKTRLNENTRIDCPGFESYFIKKHDLINDYIYLYRKVITLKEVIIENKKEYEIGNIHGFKPIRYNNYDISDLPLNILIGIQLTIDRNTVLKTINFSSSKKSNKNQMLRVRIFRKEKNCYKEINFGNLFSKPIIKGKNLIDTNIPLDEGQYFVCLEKVYEKIDYSISIGKSRKKHSQNTFSSYFINTRNGSIEPIPMNMKSGNFDVELMMSVTLN